MAFEIDVPTGIGKEKTKARIEARVIVKADTREPVHTVVMVNLNNLCMKIQYDLNAMVEGVLGEYKERVITKIKEG